jgi:hypothetical protein
MTIIEAIEARHSVRAYTDQPIAQATAEALQQEIDAINQSTGLHFQLVLNEPKAFSMSLLNYGKITGAKNYIVVAGQPDNATKERAGYFGEKLVLLAQQLGLNSLWVGLTFKKVPEFFTLAHGEVVHCVIALGYGTTQGKQHPQRRLEQFAADYDNAPEWYKNAIKMVALAPSAINQQKYTFTLRGDNRVEAHRKFSMVGYTYIDLGIAKLHFELGAGRDIEWV